MKFLLDAHIPASLKVYFEGHEVLHTSDLEHGNLTSDGSINTLSLMKDLVLITKDSDFYYSYITSRRPYKLVLVKLGNMRLKDLKIYFQKNADTVIKHLNHSSFLILEPKRIRILD
jgi:predicted nuclease of predicted toxin-antitoxin system